MNCEQVAQLLPGERQCGVIKGATVPRCVHGQDIGLHEGASDGRQAGQIEDGQQIRCFLVLNPGHAVAIPKHERNQGDFPPRPAGLAQRDHNKGQDDELLDDPGLEVDEVLGDVRDAAYADDEDRPVDHWSEHQSLVGSLVIRNERSALNEGRPPFSPQSPPGAPCRA